MVPNIVSGSPDSIALPTLEALESFLDDVTALSALEMDSASVSRSQQSTESSSTRKPTRIRQRDRLQAVRDEVASLRRQTLHENQALRESLNQLINVSSPDDAQRWKLQAVSERIRMQKADEQNSLLRERVAANSKLLEQVSSLVNKQAKYPSLLKSSTHTQICRS